MAENKKVWLCLNDIMWRKLPGSNPFYWHSSKSVMKIPQRLNDLIPCMPAGGPLDKQYLSVCAADTTVYELTLQAVGAVSELQGEVVVGGAVGVQRPRHLPAADEAVLAAQHDDRAVDQLHDELLGLTWRQMRHGYRKVVKG